MITKLLKNAVIVTVNPEREIFYHGAIAIENDRIVDIGDSDVLTEKYKNANEVWDLDGKIIFPGFINTHTHLFQTLLKGIGDDMELKDWLSNMMFPASVYLEPEDTYHAAMLGCVEGIHSGITTMLDYMYPHNREGLCDGILDAYKELGIRGILGRGCMDTGAQFGVHPGIMQQKDAVEKDIRRLFENYHNSENGRIKIWVAPAAMWSNSREMLEMLWKATNEYHSGFTVHISETPFDREAAKELHGYVDAELLEQLGIVGPNVLMVHCCWINEQDMDLIKQYDMKVSHDVCANMFLASGVAPVPQMLQKGLTLSLGVDGAASNNSQDMVELMKFTALQHKVNTRNPMAISAEKVLELATIDGARAIGMEDEIGSLEVGKKADLVVFDPLECPKAIPMHNPVSTLVYSSSLKNITDVMVDGEVLMKDGIIVKVADEKKVYRDAQKCAENLCERGKITNRREGHRWNSIY